MHGTTSKERLGVPAKTIEFNPEVLGVMDCASPDSSTSMNGLKNLVRRFLCGIVGRARLVDACEDDGCWRDADGNVLPDTDRGIFRNPNLRLPRFCRTR
jgi:hypothetical protein